jgi:hypothetical protein
VVSRFFKLKDQILSFLEMKDVMPEECKLLIDQELVYDLAFLVDILHYLNILNTRLQGKDSLFPLMFNAVNTYMLKLKLFCNNLEQGKLDNFPTLKQHYSNFTLDHLKYKAAVKSLYESFITRFSSFEPERSDIADILILSTTRIAPNNDKFLSEKQIQKSH